MYTDLFLALKDHRNPRGHPILSALLYAFCPAAARWWLAGAEPDLPFDPVWQALVDRASGITLKEALVQYGFEILLEDVRQYVAQVEVYRQTHPGVIAPERLPTFLGGQIELSRRFGVQTAIQRFGGLWQNFFLYIRTWAFLVPDWEDRIGFLEDAVFSIEYLAMICPGISRPIYYPVCVWVSQPGQVARIVVGLPVCDGKQDILRFSLVEWSSPIGDHPWPATPEIWGVDRASGESEPSAARLEREVLPQIVERFAGLARTGPYPPQAAFQHATTQCKSCPYRGQCFFEDGELTPIALNF